MYILIGIGSFVIFFIILYLEFRKRRFVKSLQKLINRVIRLSDDYIDYNSFETQYGQIEEVNYSGTKILDLTFNPLYDPKLIEKEQERINKQNRKIDQENAELQAQMSGPPFTTAQAYYGQTSYPRKTYLQNKYNTDGSYIIRLGEFTLMPKGFDFITERVIKELKKGGGKKVSKWPRLFRFMIYLSLTILVCSILWNITINFNDIVMFMVNTFISPKK